jgi:hypothetical protein
MTAPNAHPAIKGNGWSIVGSSNLDAVNTNKPALATIKKWDRDQNIVVSKE